MICVVVVLLMISNIVHGNKDVDIITPGATYNVMFTSGGNKFALTVERIEEGPGSIRNSLALSRLNTMSPFQKWMILNGKLYNPQSGQFVGKRRTAQQSSGQIALELVEEAGAYTWNPEISNGKTWWFKSKQDTVEYFLAATFSELLIYAAKADALNERIGREWHLRLAQ
jgi:hypothetical protein